jgi:hypothetical protein
LLSNAINPLSLSALSAATSLTGLMEAVRVYTDFAWRVSGNRRLGITLHVVLIAPSLKVAGRITQTLTVAGAHRDNVDRFPHSARSFRCDPTHF